MRQMTAALLTVLLQTPAVPPPPAPVVPAVTALAAAVDNDGRFEALTALLRGADLSFVVEPFTPDRLVTSNPRPLGRNVVVALGQGERALVVGAHYDASRLAGESRSRGAVDNAASAVLLVHAAQALSRERLRMRVVFVWFDMEEAGLLGSQRYVAAHSADLPALMLNFDINAYGDTMLYAPTASAASQPLRAAIEHTCTDLGIDCVRFAQLPSSDDCPFTRAGVPTASFATLPAPEAHHLWLTLNAGRGSPLAPGTPPPIMGTIHSTLDTVDKVDPATVARGAEFAAALIRRLAVN